MGMFLSQPLKLVCRDWEEIRRFLSTCRYVSDQEQFGVRDHWMPPEEFELSRKGDCDDFALWTWRQLLGLGYAARFVAGSAGRYRHGHAWVAVRVDNRTFIIEPQLARYGTFPRLETLRYRPMISVEASGSQIRFFEHKASAVEPQFRTMASLIPEWIVFQARRHARLLAWPYFALRRYYRRHSSRRPQAAEPL